MPERSPAQHAALFVSHGGGPLPVLGDAGHVELVAHLRDIAATIRKPDAIVVVSAHWEAPVVTVTANPMPPLIYDYFNFPPESYEIEYPAPGHPELAAALVERLNRGGVAAQPDADRGFDHGVFIPLKLMYPDADIPCVQVSLQAGLDPTEHIGIGGALSGLADDNVLVLGSGFSFHNLKVLLSGATDGADEANAAFESWLIETCTSRDIDETERQRRLVDWAGAPGARFCHPREEHLLPLHVCYGVAKAPCRDHAELTVMGRRCSSYFW